MLPYKVARKMIFKFVRAFRRKLTYEDLTTYTFPAPETIYETPERAIKERATVSTVKAEAIKKTARLELEGRLKEIEAMAGESTRSC